MKTGRLFLSFTLVMILMASISACSKKKGDGTGDEMGLSDEDIALREKNRWGDGNIPMADAGGPFKDVHFDFDSSTVRPEYQSVVQQNAELLNSDRSLQAVLEGHCDKRGTNEYNLALGEARAKSVAGMLVGLGVKASQISTISYGEEIPLDPGSSEEAFSKNRRVHFAAHKDQSAQ